MLPPLQEWQTAEAARQRREAAWQRRSRTSSALGATAGALANAARALKVDAWAEEHEIRCWRGPPLHVYICSMHEVTCVVGGKREDRRVMTKHRRTGLSPWHQRSAWTSILETSSLRKQF